MQIWEGFGREFHLCPDGGEEVVVWFPCRTHSGLFCAVSYWGLTGSC